MQKLWTRDFTIITLGTVVSMLGNAIAGFALGVLILEMMDSSFAFSVYLAVNSLPKLLVPGIAGTFLDRFSRVKVIYTLDFLSAFIYLLIFFSLKLNYLTFPLFLILAFTIGTIDSIYAVAYDSLYPTYITKGNFSKAYSISSMIYPFAALMTPVASFAYTHIGLDVLFIFNAFMFFVAGIFETFLSRAESHLTGQVKISKFEDFSKEFKSGIQYIFNNPGLLAITTYFFINSLFQGSVSQALEMPYFKANPKLGYTLFTYVSSANVLGRFIGGFIHYRIKLPNHHKFKIAMAVYIIITFTQGFTLFLPFLLMLVTNFMTGFFAVTSFNIRISSTQSYIPNHIRGRFNGTFQMMTMSGMILGQLIWGALGSFVSAPQLILFGNMVTLMLTFLVIYRNRIHIEPIYNQNI